MDTANGNGNIAKRDLAISRSIAEHAKDCPLHGTIKELRQTDKEQWGAINEMNVALGAANAKLWVALAILMVIAGAVLSMAFG